MNVLTSIAIIALIIMALFHFYWALGGMVGLDKALPTKDGKRLFAPGKFLTFLVGLGLVGFAFIAYLLQFWQGDYSVIGWILSIIFLLRTIGDFHVVGLYKKVKETEFSKYDTMFYLPLCLYLNVVFAILA